MVPYYDAIWNFKLHPENVTQSRCGSSGLERIEATYIYIYIYIKMIWKDLACYVYLHTAITRRSELNFDVYGKGPPWGTIWGPAWAPWGTTWDTIRGPYVDNSERFDSHGFYGGSWACFPLLLHWWGLMGLVPKRRGQHRPDSPHLLHMHLVHTLHSIRRPTGS
jgi:hypothetical protein